MKITTEGLLPAAGAQNAGPREKTSGTFHEILETVTAGETVKTAGPSAAHPPFQSAPVLLDPVSDDGLLQDLDHSLSILESYQVQLGDCGIPVDDLAPHVERLADQQRYLQSRHAALSEDHPLKDLLNRSSVTMAVEVEKYRRGDYR